MATEKKVEGPERKRALDWQPPSDLEADEAAWAH
jgi:hypothetical protein